MKRSKTTIPKSFDAFVRKEWGNPVPYYSFFSEMLPYDDVPAAVFMSFVFCRYCRRKRGEDNILCLDEIMEYTRLSKAQCEEAIETWEKAGVLDIERKKIAIETISNIKMRDADNYEVNLGTIFEFIEAGWHS